MDFFFPLENRRWLFSKWARNISQNTFFFNHTKMNMVISIQLNHSFPPLRKPLLYWLNCEITYCIFISIKLPSNLYITYPTSKSCMYLVHMTHSISIIRSCESYMRLIKFNVENEVDSYVSFAYKKFSFLIGFPCFCT